jgi:hypothetical protein
MLNFKNWLFTEMAQVRKISPEEVEKQQLFGPVYHGSTQDNLKLISQDGFKLFKGPPRTGNISNGYQLKNYADQYPPPIHHLGYGVYFTTKLSVAKNYNLGSSKGLIPYYIHAPRITTINFGAPNTMMKWWLQNGYTPSPNMSQEEWVQATENLTKTLASKYDAIWYKGKGLKTLLDGDQIVVFNTDNIFQLDNEISAGYEENGNVLKIGRKVKLKNTNIKAEILKISLQERTDYWQQLLGPSKYQLALKISLKNIEDIRQIYIEPLTKTLMSTINPEEAVIKNRIANGMSQDDAYKHFGNYLINVINRSCPSAMVESVIQKRS